MSSCNYSYICFRFFVGQIVFLLMNAVVNVYHIEILYIHMDNKRIHTVLSLSLLVCYQPQPPLQIYKEQWSATKHLSSLSC